MKKMTRENFSDEKYFIFIAARSFIHIPFTQVEFQIDPLVTKNDPK